MKNGFVTIFVVATFLIAIFLGLGVFYYKAGGFRNLKVEKNLPIPINSGKSWSLVDHTNEVSFNKELDERSFIGMRSNGGYWLLGRGYSAYSPNHFYKYSQKDGFENLSSQISDLGEIWHIAWNGENWLLGNANYSTNSQLVKYDGKKFVDLTEEFRKTLCESTYEGHITISEIFAVGDAFLIVSLTDKTSCYATYDGVNFQNVSELFPVYPSGSGREGDRIHYTRGDCNKNVCYLSYEGGYDHIVRFDYEGDKVEKISTSDLTSGQVKEAIVTEIKSNRKGEWLFQMVSFENNKVISLFLSPDSSVKAYEVIYKREAGYLRMGDSMILEGWDDSVNSWVGSSFECSKENEKLCRLILSHFDGKEIVKLPLEFPLSEEIPTISISDSSYFVSYDDKLFEVLYR